MLCTGPSKAPRVWVAALWSCHDAGRSRSCCDSSFMPLKQRVRLCRTCLPCPTQLQATSAPAASAINTPPQPQVSKEPIGLGSFVTIAPHFRNLTHAVHGPLKEGRYGVVVKTDHTSMPYKVGYYACAYGSLGWGLTPGAVHL